MTARLALVSAATLALAAPALASRVVFDETFTNATKTPNFSGPGGGPDVYTTTAAYNWYTFSPSTSTIDPSSTGNPAGGLYYSDTGSGASRLEQNLGSFAAFDTATNPADATITFSVDLRVDEYASGSGASNPRFIIKDSSRANSFYVVGFSRGVSPDAGRLFLFAGENSANTFSPTLANAIGYNSATATWATGFNFGTYDTATANNDTNDEFYRLAVTFNPFTGTSQTIDVTATQLSTGNTATFTQTVATPFYFSKNVNDGIAFNNGGSAAGKLYIDNVKVNVVPEPAALSAIALSALGLTRRRRV
jgi:hypothetical protein